ncbi:hypothetical protein [Helicobacter pylori]
MLQAISIYTQGDGQRWNLIKCLKSCLKWLKLLLKS